LKGNQQKNTLLYVLKSSRDKLQEYTYIGNFSHFFAAQIKISSVFNMNTYFSQERERE